MMDLPQSKEMVIHVPQALQRYFYELIVGGAFIVAATLTALIMMYQVLGESLPEWLRLIYFLMIALSLGVLIVGFRIVVDSENERKLASKHLGREWMMDEKHLTISLALLEGKERMTLRKFKTGALRVEWQDIQKIIVKEAVKLPKVMPACLEIYVENHEDTLGFDTVLRVRRDLLGTQEARILDFCRSHKVVVEVEAPSPSSQSVG
jgi:hypothetical protein